MAVAETIELRSYITPIISEDSALKKEFTLDSGFEMNVVLQSYLTYLINQKSKLDLESI